MHEKNFAHLDLKLNNILLDELFNVWIGDFGSAIHCETKRFKMKRKRGTQNYMAPEVRDLSQGKSYDPKKADVYSLGVCLFVLLFKQFPTLNTNVRPYTSNETSSVPNPFTVFNEKWCKVSNEVWRLLLKMLEQDPRKWPTMNEVCGCDWILDYQSCELHVYETMCKL